MKVKAEEVFSFQSWSDPLRLQAKGPQASCQILLPLQKKGERVPPPASGSKTGGGAHPPLKQQHWASCPLRKPCGLEAHGPFELFDTDRNLG